MPNVTAVNVLGDFDIAVDRLAIIDGEGGRFLDGHLECWTDCCFIPSRSMETRHTPQ